MPPLESLHSSSALKFRGSAASRTRTPRTSGLSNSLVARPGARCARPQWEAARQKPQLRLAWSATPDDSGATTPVPACSTSPLKLPQIECATAGCHAVSEGLPLLRQLSRTALAALASAVLLLAPAAPPYHRSGIAHAESAGSSSSSSSNTNETYSGVAAYESAVRDRGDGTYNMSLFTDDARQAMAK